MLVRYQQQQGGEWKSFEHIWFGKILDYATVAVQPNPTATGTYDVKVTFLRSAISARFWTARDWLVCINKKDPIATEEEETKDPKAAEEKAKDANAGEEAAKDSNAAEEEAKDANAAEEEAEDYEAKDPKAAGEEAKDSKAAEEEVKVTKVKEANAGEEEEVKNSKAKDAKAAEEEGKDSKAKDPKAAEEAAKDSEAKVAKASEEEVKGLKAKDSKTSEVEDRADILRRGSVTTVLCNGVEFWADHMTGSYRRGTCPVVDYTSEPVVTKQAVIPTEAFAGLWMEGRHVMTMALEAINRA